MKFSGYQISTKANETDPYKLVDVKQWLVLIKFPGFCGYYRKFVEHFSRIAGPLHDLSNLCVNLGLPSKGNQVMCSL